MKVIPADRKKIAALIELLDTPERRKKYSMLNFPRSNRVTDLNKRYRWDLFWDSKAYQVITSSKYLTVDLDATLKSIVSVLPEMSRWCDCEEPSFDFRNVCRKCYRQLKITPDI